MKYFASLLNKSKAVTGSVKEACPMKAVVETSKSLNKCSKKLVNESSNGKKIEMDIELITVEKATKQIRVFFDIYNIGYKKQNRFQ